MSITFPLPDTRTAMLLLAILFAIPCVHSGSIGSKVCENSTMIYDQRLHKCCTQCLLINKQTIETLCTETADTVCKKLSEMGINMVNNNYNYQDPAKPTIPLVDSNTNNDTVKPMSINRNHNRDYNKYKPPEDDIKTTPTKSASLSDPPSTLEIILVVSFLIIFMVITLVVVGVCIRRRLFLTKSTIPQPPAPAVEEEVTYPEGNTNSNNNRQNVLYLSDDYVSPCDITTALLQCRQMRTSPGDSDSTSLASSTESGIQEEYNHMEFCTMNARKCLRDRNVSESEASGSSDSPNLPNGSCPTIPAVPHRSPKSRPTYTSYVRPNSARPNTAENRGVSPQNRAVPIKNRAAPIENRQEEQSSLDQCTYTAVRPSFSSERPSSTNESNSQLDGPNSSSELLRPNSEPLQPKSLPDRPNWKPHRPNLKQDRPTSVPVRPNSHSNRPNCKPDRPNSLPNLTSNHRNPSEQPISSQDRPNSQPISTSSRPNSTDRPNLAIESSNQLEVISECPETVLQTDI